jgi:hypothetical protein
VRVGAGNIACSGTCRCSKNLWPCGSTEVEMVVAYVVLRSGAVLRAGAVRDLANNEAAGCRAPSTRHWCWSKVTAQMRIGCDFPLLTKDDLGFVHGSGHGVTVSITPRTQRVLGPLAGPSLGHAGAWFVG